MAKETLDLLLKLDVQGDAQLKGMANDADKAAQRLTELAQKTDIATRTMAAQQKELAGLQNQYRTTAARATELADKLDTVVAAEGKNSAAATKLQAELDRTAGAAQKLALAIDKKEISLQRGSNALQKIAAEANRTGTALTTQAAAAEKSASAHVSLTRSGETAGNAFSGMASKLTSLATGYFTLQGAIQGVEWAKQGAAMQDVQASFEKLAVSAGTTGDTLLAAMQKASKGTIANSDLMAKANAANILTQGRLVSELPKLLEIAGASAKAMGTNVNEAFDSIVLGLSRNSKMIIDNLGFTVDIEAANLRYAESLGIAVTALTDEQKAQAFTNEVLAQGDQLVQTIGTSTLTSAEKIAQAETRIRNFTDSLKVMAGEGLAGAADGLTYLNQLLAGDGGGGQQAQAISATAQSYEQYVAAINGGNEAMLRSTTAQQSWLNALGPLGSMINGVVGAQQQFVGTTEIMSEAQYNASQALQEVGYSAEQANAMVAGLAGQQTILTAVTGALVDAEGMDAEAKKAMVDQTIALASASPEAASEIAGLIERVVSGEMTGLQYADALAIMTAESGGASQAALDLANSLLVADDATTGATQSTWDMIDSTYEEELAHINAAMAAEESARFHEDLAWAADMTASSADGAAAASAYLVSVYGLEISQVNELTAATNQLNLARAGKQGNAAGRAAGGLAKRITNPETGGAMGYHQRRVDSAERAERARGTGKKSGGGGAAKKPKESEASKAAKKEAAELDKIDEKVEKAKTDHQRKLEDLEKKHVEKLQAIDDDYHAKALAAERKFNTDKFDERASFKEGLLETDQDLWDRANAQQDAYWQEAQAMAQAGHQQQADEYYAAGLALADMQAQHAQKLRDDQAAIDTEEDEAEKARLQQRLERERQLYAEQEQLAKDKVDAVRTGGDQLEQERTDAIAKENEDYSEAQDTLKADFQETLADIKTSYADMGAAARELADGIIATAQAATTAVNAIPMPSASGAPAGEAPQGSYATGTGDSGLPTDGPIIGHRREIILNNPQSNALRRIGGTQALDNLNRGAMPLASRRVPTSPSTAGGVSTSITNAPSISVAVSVAGTNATTAQITAAAEAGAEKALAKFNRQTGGRADVQQKMGGR